MDPYVIGTPSHDPAAGPAKPLPRRGNRQGPVHGATGNGPIARGVLGGTFRSR